MEKVTEEILEDFSTYKVGKLPDDGWRSRDGDPHVVYTIQAENGDPYLQAVSIDNTVQLFREKGWAIREKPILSWKWRAHEFPKSSGEWDSVAGVYVVFPNRWFIPETIKYVWSDKLPVGTVIRKKDRFPKIVIRQGIDDKGKWVVEERNVFKDYEMLFGRAPSNPVAFGMLSDSNETHAKALADYDDFRVYEVIKGKPETAPELPKTSKKKK